MGATRYRFADFVVSRGQRQLSKGGRELPLIPRYFDLLVLLIERRQTAVSRQEIFDAVWSDVIVSDGALSQAVRTLRRALGDDSREPMFIRTIPRHGYRFVFTDVIEEAEGQAASHALPATAGEGSEPTVDRLDELIDRLLQPSHEPENDEDRREAAEELHALGTAIALERLKTKAGHARALAILRDARWTVPRAGAVPLLGQPEGLAAARRLIELRAAEAFRIARGRWAGAVWGASAAGALAGLIGGLMLALAPTSEASAAAMAVLAGIGAVAGGGGAAGVAAGLAAGEALARSRRALAIVALGGIGGFSAGLIGHLAVRWTLEELFGLRLPIVGGPLEGLTLGAAAGAGYAVTTRRPGGGGMATPAGPARVKTAVAVAACCAVGGLGLALAGRPLVGGLINTIAQASRGSNMALAPLGTLVGEPSFGPLTRSLLSVVESGLFGFGLAFGLTTRRR